MQHSRVRGKELSSLPYSYSCKRSRASSAAGDFGKVGRKEEMMAIASLKLFSLDRTLVHRRCLPPYRRQGKQERKKGSMLRETKNTCIFQTVLKRLRESELKYLSSKLSPSHSLSLTFPHFPRKPGNWISQGATSLPPPPPPPAPITRRIKSFPSRLPPLTLGTLSLEQIPSERSLSRISQAKMEGHSRLYSEMRCTTLGVATRGLEPPIARGFIVPVS